jgi:hypothetical protein
VSKAINGPAIPEFKMMANFRTSDSKLSRILFPACEKEAKAELTKEIGILLLI